MRNFQQNLLVLLALGLCGLCVVQWRGQATQRVEIDKLNRSAYKKSSAIRDYTNSIQTMDRQISLMDGHLSELKETVKTNDDLVVSQKREISHLLLISEGLTNEIGKYKKALDLLETKLKESYDGIKKQNEAIKELAGQRDDFVKKFNDSVKDRNEVVAKYNALVEQVNRQQAGNVKQ